jgi:hypothetical protein
VIKERKQLEGGSEEKKFHVSREQYGASGGERWRKGAREEIFLVDNWVLVGSLTRTGSGLEPFVPSTHRFDYDTYKILRAFVQEPVPTLTISTPPPEEWRSLVRSAATPA